jgi:hypothetical protein
MLKERVKHDTRRMSRNETLKQSIPMGESGSFRNKNKNKTAQERSGGSDLVWEDQIYCRIDLFISRLCVSAHLGGA